MYEKQRRSEPPAYDRTLSFKTFAKLDPEYRRRFPYGRISPRNVREYLDYKYYAIAHGFNAVGGAKQPEEQAYVEAVAFFHFVESVYIDFLTEDSENPYVTFNLV